MRKGKKQIRPKERMRDMIRIRNNDFLSYSISARSSEFAHRKANYISK
jgi:hypothetical protein